VGDTRHIGIVAVSPEGGALCYRQIFRQASRFLPPERAPRVSIHNESLARYIQAVRNGDWHAVGSLLRRSAELLARCGCEFCICPDNAVQHAIQLAEVGSPIPWLTMPDLVADAVERDERSVVGIIGTKMVTTGSTYQTHLGLKGIRVLTPLKEEVEALDRIIFGELIYGEIREESQKLAVEVIGGLGSRGCEAVIIASSEAPLLISRDTSPLPVYDAADLLAEGAVRRAIAD
jgi:aspartate racemase